jgi:SAM-dependent methyltransferase
MRGIMPINPPKSNIKFWETLLENDLFRELRFLLPLLKSKKELFIFGTGLYGEKFAVYFLMKKKKICAFLDSNASLHSKLFYGVKIISPKSLLNNFPKNAIILIASKDYAQEIQNILQEAGLKNEIDFINPFTKEDEQLLKFREITNRLEYAAAYLGKQAFKSKGHKDIFAQIYKQNLWGSKESGSGPGSQINTTKKIRKILPQIWKKYSIKTFLDIPCGDYNWMKEVDKTGIEYIGADIVKHVIANNNKTYKAPNACFKVLDATKDNLPKVDMIFCKDCLQHLSYENVWKVLRNFKRSGSKYLLVTSYPLTLKNWNILDGDHRPLNLQKAPFNLPKPQLKILEIKIYSQIDKTMYLYKLDDLVF